MSKTLTLDGNKYVVSPKWAQKIEASLGGLTFTSAALEESRQLWLTTSNRRSLSASERVTLDAVTHVRNVANTIRVVGAHHDPVKEWGLDGWDAVHGNAHHQECGCIKHYVFDHHSVTNHFGHNRVSAERMHHEIEPLNVCETHKAG